jgi:hypothetical protein
MKHLLSLLAAIALLVWGAHLARTESADALTLTQVLEPRLG